ncbi:ATP-binding cassette domain-containing protein [Liquorilactobacillus satsumensis]|uniref:Peptide ABC transporter ATPase n=1 Tax=Liquorilactobacillus satsumensis DSM 16230 = JCM 12392 TaxID=1423801 RepID=A0A0R1V0P5_9LACO|nr:ATP-binding cassette domain-containing protein [Liquorilactobacillus satsumensis]KRL96915.1 peptide ABC transporter ATPase [Liquorilactobacillus satsumensis DSM 16230 = JCM 12392]MCC7667804.1 ABC transporter [Liquorilactobacillus satsumensis]MCP9312427.1 ATP-binding cassette domain-containing protein [Liquorilactobacillus satsumensis]MCP9329013.1 ATP-binding cassette domain-containing protein [Liquorilactobacillus satsumensis]MCP9358564.1 ATP-binding cassette domain-containing protein [Liqu
MLRTKKLSYWYGNAANKLFDHVDLEFTAGHLYAVVGKSGVGKTTFLSLLAGLTRPSKGVIEFEGRGLAKIGMLNYRKRHVSMIFQTENLFSYMSALDNLLTAMEITEAHHAGDQGYALQQLEQSGIDRRSAQCRVTQLTLEQQQRVAVARTMCCDSQIIVADEPTNQVGQEGAGDILELLQAAAYEQQRCVIVGTKKVEVAKKCDAVVELHQRKFEWL